MIGTTIEHHAQFVNEIREHELLYETNVRPLFNSILAHI